LFQNGFNEDLFKKCLAAQGLKLGSINLNCSDRVYVNIMEDSQN
jgi:hypothetical protein